jgi:two-component system, NarL family, competent response regulator ComA
MLHILLVDDHPSVMEGTKIMLQKESDLQVAMARNEAEALELVRGQRFDAMLFDMNMPDISGVELAQRVLAIMPDAVILIYTGYDIKPHLNMMIEAGVCGFIPKTVTQESLVTSIRCALRGESVVPVSIWRELSRASEERTGSEKGMLHSKDLEILRQIARGMSNKEIANRMLVSQRSLEYTLTALFHKLGVRSRIEAVTKVKQNGLLNLEELG